MKKSILTNSEVKAVKALALDKILTGIKQDDCTLYFRGLDSLHENDIITIEELTPLTLLWEKIKKQ